MDNLKRWVALSVTGCLAIMAAGWFLLVAPQRAEAEELRVAAQAQNDLNATLRTRLQALAAQARDLPAQQATLAEIAQQIPADAGLPDLVRALENNARAHRVDLVDISPGLPAPLAAPAATPTGVPAPAGGLSVVTLTLNVVGPYFSLQQFLGGLEGLTRATRVTGLTLAPGTSPLTAAAARSVQDGRTLNAVITAQVYVSGAATAPVPGAPAAATTAAPAPTGVPAQTGVPAAPATEAVPPSGTVAEPAAGGDAAPGTTTVPATAIR
jgi:hypothetical protein